MLFNIQLAIHSVRNSIIVNSQSEVLLEKRCHLGFSRLFPCVVASSEKTRRALDIRKEPPALRDCYGRHLFGQSAPMARRLIEADVRFVTVHYEAIDGYGWDTHVHNNDVRNHLLPTFDQALGALLVDLDDRGLLKETLVVALGEMGRTPAA